MDDLISRQAAIDALNSINGTAELDEAFSMIENLPSAQPEPLTVNIDHELTKDECDRLKQAMRDAPILLLPSAQPEPLSDAYTKAVWTWLLDYQIKAAELKGKYTPYEVLSWVANDWRKEHEGSD
jgi:hypothetical protein